MVLLLISKITTKTLPCIRLTQENWAASFVNVQEIFADPYVQGVTEYSVIYSLMYEFLIFPPYKWIFTFSTLLFSWKEKCIKLFYITFFHCVGKIQRNTASLNDMEYAGIAYLRSSVQIKINKASQKKAPKDLSSAWSHFPAYTSFYPTVMY